MATTIKLKNSVTATNAPSSLVQGEVAINVTDKKVWVGNAATTPIQLLGGGADGSFTNISVSSVATFGAGAVGTPAITTTGDTNTGIFFPAADTIAFAEGGAEAMRILSDGTVGIGTSSPFAKLCVVGSASANSIMTETSAFFGQSNGLNIGSDGTDTLLGVGNSGTKLSLLSRSAGVFSKALTIDSSGNVGIGTSSPSEKLSVTGNVTATGTNTSATYFHRSIAPATESGIETSLITTGNGANQRAGLFATNDYASTLATGLIFKTNATTGGATERMRINAGGDVQIGTTNITNGGFSFDAGYNGAGKSAALFGHITGTGSGNQYCIFYYDGTIIGSITQNGTTAVAYNTTSDYRLKENIAPMTNALAKVAQLKPVTYTWKADGSDGQGFIAHELQAVVPDAVTGEKDAVDKDGKPTYQGVDTSYLVATLTAAIQEQQAMIEELKQEVAKLKGN